MQSRLAAAILTGVVLAPLSTASTAHADVHLIIRDGHVNLDAREVTVKQILTEWARVGQTRVVNMEKLAGGPVTLQLTNVPEAQALDILLRSISGYMAAPRPVNISNASQFDRILVMPTSTPPRVAPTSPALQPPQPFGPPGALPLPLDDQDDDEPPPGSQPIPVPNPRGPIFPQYPNPSAQMPGAGPRGPAFQQQQPPTFPPNAYPQAPPFPPQQGAAPAQNAPTGVMPVGVAVPGMVVQPPGQPVNAQPPQN